MEGDGESLGGMDWVDFLWMRVRMEVVEVRLEILWLLLLLVLLWVRGRRVVEEGFLWSLVGARRVEVDMLLV